MAVVARGEGRAIVTENVADFAAERDVVLVFVLKKNLPAGGGQAAALAKVLDRWAQEHPDPYLGAHWPRSCPAAGVNDNGRRFLQELPTQRRKDYARVCSSIAYREDPCRDRRLVRRGA